jgi:hypothetical protein
MVHGTSKHKNVKFLGWGSVEVVRRDRKKLGLLPHPVLYNGFISI